MKHYSEAFKQIAVQKYLSRGSKSTRDISNELGVSRASLYLWGNEYASTHRMTNESRRPKDWSSKEKLDAVIEYEKLDTAQQGEFLRKAGLHSDNIIEWKKCMQNGLESPDEAPVSRAEVSQLKAENKALERDLNKKDKALAEASALLILKKKADLIWGSGENE